VREQRVRAACTAARHDVRACGRRALGRCSAVPVGHARHIVKCLPHEPPVVQVACVQHSTAARSVRRGAGELDAQATVLRFYYVDSPPPLTVGLFFIHNHADGTYSGGGARPGAPPAACSKPCPCHSPYTAPAPAPLADGRPAAGPPRLSHPDRQAQRQRPGALGAQAACHSRARTRRRSARALAAAAACAAPPTSRPRCAA